MIVLDTKSKQNVEHLTDYHYYVVNKDFHYLHAVKHSIKCQYISRKWGLDVVQ